MLILSYSNFASFDEIQGLLVGHLQLVDHDFSVQFFNGKHILRVGSTVYHVYLLKILTQLGYFFITLKL